MEGLPHEPGTASSSASSIALLNRRAVEQLRAGSCDAAQQTLQAALTRFRRGLLEAQSAQDDAEEDVEDVDDEDEGGDWDRGGSWDWGAKVLELVTQTAASDAGPDPIEDGPAADDDDDDVVDVDVGVKLVSLGDTHPPYAAATSPDSRSSFYYLVQMGMAFSYPGDRDAEDGRPRADEGSEADDDDALLLASPRSSARTTAVLCYNLAMTYHLKALGLSSHDSVSHSHSGSHSSRPDEREAHLRKAARLYGLGLRPIGILAGDSSNARGGSGRRRRGRRRRRRRGQHQNDFDDPVDDVDPSSVRILASLYNNKGHAHHCLGEADHAKACVRALAGFWDDTEEEEGPEETGDRGSAAAASAAAAASVGGTTAVVARALGEAALPVALNVHLHLPGSCDANPASSA